MTPDDINARLTEIRKKAAAILKAVRAGTHPYDIRDAGQYLDGKWDQDFPTALLELCADTTLAQQLAEARAELQRCKAERAVAQAEAIKAEPVSAIDQTIEEHEAIAQRWLDCTDSIVTTMLRSLTQGDKP